MVIILLNLSFPHYIGCIISAGDAGFVQFGGEKAEG